MKRIVSIFLSISLAAAILMTSFASAQTVVGKKADANGDGNVDIIDIALMRSHIVGNSTLTGTSFVCADINADGVVDIIDVVMARNAIVNALDLGDVTTESEDTSTEVSSDTETDSISETDIQTDTEIISETEIDTEDDTQTEIDTQTEEDTEIEPVLLTFEAEADSNTFSGSTMIYSGVGEDNYKEDFAAESSGEGYVRLEREGKVEIPLTVEHHGIYSLKVVAYSTGKTLNVAIQPSNYSNSVSVADYKTLDNGWDTITDDEIELQAGEYKIVLSCTDEVYNVCVDYVQIQSVEFIKDSDTEVDTQTEEDTETETDTQIDTQTDTDTDVQSDTDSGDTDYNAEIPADVITSLTSDWFLSPDGSDEVSTVTSITKLANGGLRVNFDLNTEEYTYLTNFTGGLDLSSHSTINVVVYNPNELSVQLVPIFKTGELWKWTEYDKYQTIPAKTATMLTFDMSTTTRTEVNAMIFRIQSSGTKCAGNLDILSIGYDLDADAYKGAIAEINRPKSADYFTWNYPESDWTAHTTSTNVSGDAITVAFSGISSNNAAGVQTETKPGLGEGMDLTDYSALNCTITNNCTDDIHITLVVKTGGGWLWQENGGTVADETENERIIPAGASVDVSYIFGASTWKSAASNWNYTGELSGGEDARAIAFKIYAGTGESATGSVVISNFEFKLK